MTTRKKPRAKPGFRPQLEALAGQLLGGETALGARPAFRPQVEVLEERVAPATWTGAVSGDFTDGRNWNTGVVPGPTDSAFFTATYNVGCYIPPGIGVNIAGLSIAAGYTRTITLSSASFPPFGIRAATLGVSGLSLLDGGTIDQTDPGCTVTLGGGT